MMKTKNNKQSLFEGFLAKSGGLLTVLSAIGQLASFRYDYIILACLALTLYLYILVKFFSKSFFLFMLYFCLLILLTLPSKVISSGDTLQSKNKVDVKNVIVADFDGPEPRRHQVTDEIIAKLMDETDAINPNSDIRIIRTPRITAEEGSKKAQKLQVKHDAVLVIWGSYSEENGSMWIRLNIENGIEGGCLDFPKQKKMLILAKPKEINIKLKQRLSEDLSSFVLFAAGIIHYENYESDRAIKLFTRALEQKESVNIFNKSNIHYYLGLIYFDKGNYLEAEKKFKLTLANDKQFYENYLSLGVTLIELDKNQESLEYLNKAYHLSPCSEDVLLNKAIAKLNLNRSDESIKDLMHALQLNAKNSDVYFYLARAYYEKEKYDIAKQMILKSIYINPNDAPSYHLKGLIEESSGNYREALFSVNKSLSIDNKQPEYFSLKSRIHSRFKAHDEALLFINRAISIDNTNKEYLIDRVSVFVDQITFHINNSRRSLNEARVFIKPIDAMLLDASTSFNIKQYKLNPETHHNIMDDVENARKCFSSSAYNLNRAQESYQKATRDIKIIKSINRSNIKNNTTLKVFDTLEVKLKKGGETMGEELATVQKLESVLTRIKRLPMFSQVK